MDKNADKVPSGVWLFWVLIFTGIGVYVLGHLVLKGEYTYLQTLILALTLFAIIWYTYESHKMQQAVSGQVEAAIEQTNVGILPVFTLRIGEVFSEFDDNILIPRLELENIGNGKGLMVQTQLIKIRAPALSQNSDEPWEPYITFRTAIAISEGERRVIEHNSWNNFTDGTQELTGANDLLIYLTKEKLIDLQTLKIIFTDILGNIYSQEFTLSHYGFWPDIVRSYRPYQ